MQNKAILIPLCLQVFLTAVVWCFLIFLQVKAIKQQRVDPNSLTDDTKADAVFKDALNASDNLENLFELPVLFYVACLVIFSLKATDNLYFALALTFVFLRGVHSFIHCTYNRVTHRFNAYAASALILWLIWLRIAFQIVQGL